MVAPEMVKAYTRLVREVWNQGNYRAAYSVLAESYVDHGTSITVGPGPAGFVALVKELRGAFKGFRYHPRAAMAQGDSLSTRFTVTGTHVAPLFRVSPTRKAVRFRGMAMYRFTDAHIAEAWTLWDVHDLLCQIGKAEPLSGPSLELAWK
jgi:predicted ester cyclase